jgi:hypothetical protein
MTQEEQKTWFETHLIPRVANFSLQGDVVEEIYIVDELFDVVAEVLSNASLPEDFPLNGMDKEFANENFRTYCSQNIVLRPARLDQLAIPNVEIAPEMQFLRIQTTGMKLRQFLDHWDGELGFTESLKMRQIPVVPSYEDKKILFLLTYLLEHIATKAQQQIQVVNGAGGMFTPQ